MKQLRILIADDDHHARAGLRAFLSAIVPCEIVGEATNGVEILVQAARHHPHVVVLDLRMPELDGIQATRMLKAGGSESSYRVEWDDAHLAAALRQGDEAAFEMLVGRYHTSLIRLAQHYVSSYALAEEVAQDTWVAMLHGPARQTFPFQTRLKQDVRHPRKTVRSTILSLSKGEE